MSKPVVFTWPAANTTAVCDLQNVAGAGPLILNGSLVNSGIAILSGVSRTVSITSANNLSGATFTITGTLLGNTVSQANITGPNANTIYSTQLFDSVTSVIVSGAVNGVSVGSGTTGRTPWINYNYHSDYGAVAIQAIVSNTINYSLVTTFENVVINFNSPDTSPIPNATGVTANLFLPIIGPLGTYSAFTVNNGTTNGSATFYYVQQGIT